ncbi:hypothetical protein ACFYNO_02075 [Kitasatospora sp. NPDC006697]|uniref:hypothetical protein n=1 Tax=Kitasatospora sp. NPDC006697 TaxID=3364020 RepID=UPI0036CFF0B7
MAVVGILAVTATVIGINGYEQLVDVPKKNKRAALAAVDARAHTFADQLTSAFSTGPQTVTSLQALARNSTVTNVFANQTSTSVTIAFISETSYADGWTGSLAQYCYQDTLIRGSSGVSGQLLSISCSALPTRWATASEQLSVR